MNIDIRMAHLFSALNDDHVRQVMESSHTGTFKDGESLFETGDEANRFFLVIGGQIKLFRVSSNGDQKIIDIIQPGNTFAEALMFMEHPIYPVSAEALGPAKVISFDNQRFLQILSQSIDVCFRIMGTMSQRLRSLIKEIDDLTLQSATTRLCAMLLRRMDDVGQDHFTLPAAKGVLAARLSMKPETFSRILQNLATKNIINTKSNEIQVLDENLLRSLAHLESIFGLEPENPCPQKVQNVYIDLN
ncbi:Crp/Fnr family transcriptional regulator [Candidatus Thiodiazotropha sp. CDECU1]|uniref:Crp/Fnr family transcriptional regulator n=1 Tax=Candidatus Thiodiazotropha sp. CDECU1 TaxID=3065865 RepID=UPI0029304986|nr:Crp/Fnr family transcriptional regulator [Candidatus Thiodiazotropha sp. CDECU1]